MQAIGKEAAIATSTDVNLLSWTHAVNTVLLPLIVLFLLLSSQARAQTTDPSDFVGSWRSDFRTYHFIGFNLDIVATGDPVRILKATGFAGRTPITTTQCNNIAARGTERGRWALGMCESVEKGDLKPVEIDLQIVDGSYRGVDVHSGAIFEFSRPSGNPNTPINIDVTIPRGDGTSENYGLGYLYGWGDRTPIPAYAGPWSAEVAGLSIDLDLRPAGNTVAAEFRYFPDGQGNIAGPVTLGLGEVAAKERSFAMLSSLRHSPGRSKNSVLTAAVRHLPDEWQIDHSHFIAMRLLTSATLEVMLARTRDDLLNNRVERILFRPLDRALREVAPIPGAFEGMSGLWTGKSGPLTVELDIEVPSDGALKGEIRHFDDGGGAFPAGVSGGFTWAHEVVTKERPFAAYMAGTGDRTARSVNGTVETGPQGNINWTTTYRLRKQDEETLLLDYSVPNQPVAFGGPPIELKRFDGPLREVAQPIEEFPSPETQSVAGLWTFRTGERGGGVYLLRLDEAKANLDGRFIAQFVPQTTGGECERFARTQGICELARDKGPINTAIRLEPTGDSRWTHMGAHGVRAFGGDLPAYTDLRIRVAPGPSPNELLVQMTANDAFGLAPEGTYIFSRVGDASRLNLSTGIDQEGKIYVAKDADAIGGGACESWAKEDSLLRQRNNAALTAELDAILGAQALSVSGHPMDRQCKSMLDAISALNTQQAEPAPENSEDGLAGEWVRMGQAYYSFPLGGIWRGDNPVNATSDRFNLTGDATAYQMVIDGTAIGPLVKAGFGLEALGSHLDRATLETDNRPIKDWLGADVEIYQSFSGGGDALLLGADASDRQVFIAFGTSRAVVVAAALHGLTDLELGIGTVPQTLNLIPFERSGKVTPTVEPDPQPEPGPVANNGADPSGPSVPDNQSADAGRSAVCLALEARTAQLNAAADTATVQIIRSIYSDVGLAFGGEETEAKCQSALDQLAGLALIGPNANADDANSGTTIVNVDNSTTIVNNVVGNLTNFVNNGGSWSAPDAPDACGALAPISGGLRFSGGMEINGLLGDLFLSIGFDSTNRAAQEQCYNALYVLDDLGLDPADTDNMATVIEIVNTIVPPRTTPDGRPLATPGRELSRACEAWFGFAELLYAKGVPELENYLAAVEASFGDPNGRNMTPAARDCSLAIRDALELGLDPALPDGGWAQAILLLSGSDPVRQVLPVNNPVPQPTGPVGGYDPRPEQTRESVSWRDEFRYIFPFPDQTGRFDGINPANLTVLLVPDNSGSSDNHSPLGVSTHCTETEHTLPALEAQRVWAFMRQLTRDLGLPSSITTGRDCVFVQAAVNALFALGNGPEVGNGAPDIVFDRRLDGMDLNDEARAVAARTMGVIVNELATTQPSSWSLLVVSQPVAEAFIGDKVSTRSAIVYDRVTRSVISDFTIHMGNAD